MFLINGQNSKNTSLNSVSTVLSTIGKSIKNLKDWLQQMYPKKVTKILFTDKIRYHMLPALEKFETAIEFESDDKREFITDISKVQPLINKLLKREANKILKNEN